MVDHAWAAARARQRSPLLRRKGQAFGPAAPRAGERIVCVLINELAPTGAQTLLLDIVTRTDGDVDINDTVRFITVSIVYTVVYGR